MKNLRDVIGTHIPTFILGTWIPTFTAHWELKFPHVHWELGFPENFWEWHTFGNFASGSASTKSSKFVYTRFSLNRQLRQTGFYFIKPVFTTEALDCFHVSSSIRLSKNRFVLTGG